MQMQLQVCYSICVILCLSSISSVYAIPAPEKGMEERYYSATLREEIPKTWEEKIHETVKKPQPTADVDIEDDTEANDWPQESFINNNGAEEEIYSTGTNASDLAPSYELTVPAFPSPSKVQQLLPPGNQEVSSSSAPAILIVSLASVFVVIGAIVAHQKSRLRRRPATIFGMDSPRELPSNQTQPHDGEITLAEQIRFRVESVMRNGRATPAKEFVPPVYVLPPSTDESTVVDFGETVSGLYSQIVKEEQE